MHPGYFTLTGRFALYIYCARRSFVSDRNILRRILTHYLLNRLVNRLATALRVTLFRMTWNPSDFASNVALHYIRPQVCYPNIRNCQLRRADRDRMGLPFHGFQAQCA